MTVHSTSFLRASLAEPAKRSNPHNNRPKRIENRKTSENRIRKFTQPAKDFAGPRESAPPNRVFADFGADSRGPAFGQSGWRVGVFTTSSSSILPQLAAAAAASAAACESLPFPAASDGAPPHASCPGRGGPLPPVSPSRVHGERKSAPPPPICR